MKRSVKILITSEPSEQELKTVARCVDEQRAYLEYVWTFETGQTIKLRLGKIPKSNRKSSGTDHKLRLLYTRRVPVKQKISPPELAL